MSLARDGLAVQLELKPFRVETWRRLRRDALGHELGLGHGPLGAVHEQHPLELADGHLVKLVALLQQLLGLGDEHRVAVEGGEGLAGPLGGGVMLGLHVRGGGPRGLLAARSRGTGSRRSPA